VNPELTRNLPPGIAPPRQKKGEGGGGKGSPLNYDCAVCFLHICKYIYIYVYVGTYTYICICIYIYVYICLHI